MSANSAPDLDTMLDNAFKPDTPAPEAAPASPSAGAPPSAPSSPSSPTPAPSQPAAAATPEKRALKVKFDHEEQEIDLDEHWKDEQKRARLKEYVEKGYGFDRVVTRTKQEAEAAGRQATINWLVSHGFTFKQQPDGSYIPVPPQPVATPAATPSAPPAISRAELEKLADEGDTKAIRELIRLEAEAARQAAEAKFEQKFTEATRARQEAEARIREQAAERQIVTAVEKEFEALAKSYGPDAERVKVRLLHECIAHAKSGVPQTMQDVLQPVRDEAARLARLRESWVKDLQSKPPAPTPSPVLDGTPPGAKNPALDKRPSLDDDEYWEAAIAESRQAR